MRKQILSILLCLVMVVGLFPTMAFAADGSGATTGSGTASDPYIVTTFDELKAELEKETVGLGMQYIKVPSGTNITKVLKLDAYDSAIKILRQKTLIVDGTVTVTGAASGSVVRSLLYINGSGERLDIKGKGSLTFEATSNGGATNAVVDVENDATVNISGGVTLTGAYNLATYGIAVYNAGGTVNIDNATLEGKTGGVSYGGAVYAIKGTTNIKNAIVKSSVLPGTNITKNSSGTIFIDEDATLTIENSIIHTTDGVTDGHSIYLHQGNTKHISDYLGTNQKIYKLSDDTPLSADVRSLTDSVNITDDISKEINTVSLTVEPLITRETISDLACSYSPSNKMTLSNFIVYKGWENTSDKIEDKNTPYDPNQSYTVMYLFLAKAGFSFSDNLRDNLKDNVTVTGGDFWIADDYGGLSNAIRVFVNIPAASAAGQEVKTVTIQVKPKAERTKLEDFNCQSYTPTGGMGNPARFLREGLNTDGSGSTPTAYDKDKDYSVVYQFPINPGYTIAEGISTADVTINDGQVWKVSSDSDGKNLLVYVNFPAASTAGQVVKTVTIQVKPKAERTKLEDFDCQSYTPTGGMGNPARFLREGLNTDGSGSTPTAYDKDKDYSVVYQFPINPGYTIAEGISTADVTINDGQVWKVSSDSDGKNLLVYVNFPAASTAGQVVKTVTIQVKPKAERTKLEDFDCQSYTPTGGMGNPARFLREGLNTDGSGSTPTAYDKDKDYSVVYQFPINPGYTIAEGISTADVTINDGQVWQVKSDSDGKNLLVYVNFPAKAAEDPNYVTEAAVQIAAPVAGEKPKGTVDIPVLGDNKDKVKKAMMWWSGMLSGNTAFVAGQEYTAIVYLEPKEGVTFADDMKLNVNGKVVDLLSKDPDGSVQFKVMFTATGSTHTHSYGTDWKYDDTNHWHECECGDKADIEAHSASEWIIDTAATETAEGAKHKECTVCKKVLETATIPATHTHSYGTDWKYDDTNHWHECECGDKADVAAHSASEWIVDTAATETAEGAKHKECTVCKKVLETATIPATGSDHTHSYGEDWKYNDTDHWHECECGDKADVAAHSASEWIVDTAATETAEGAKHKECTICKKVLETATIPATHTHSYGTDWKYDDTNHWHECECGDKADVAAHSASEWIVDTAATETAEGAKHKECTVCKKVLETATIPATHTHSYGTDWKYDDTNHWHECECGDKADVAAHNASEWIVDTAATETAEGAKHKECTVCKKVLETATIPATGSTHTHSYGTDWKYDDTNHWHECECRDKADTAAHSFQWVIDKAATKKATGIKHEECTVCGAKRSENTVIAKLSDSGSTGNTGSGDNNTAKPGKDDSTKSPRTGDSSNLIGWLAALFVSGGVLTVLGVRVKKRKESEAE
ncbi:hypothetical protein KE530_06970 [Clostridiaceae bacterium Marseille-Q4145]|nr:hypothetical protein [Clostridiaceae bacterium Marseille-Q4145]